MTTTAWASSVAVGCLNTRSAEYVNVIPPAMAGGNAFRLESLALEMPGRQAERLNA